MSACVANLESNEYIHVTCPQNPPLKPNLFRPLSCPSHPFPIRFNLCRGLGTVSFQSPINKPPNGLRIVLRKHPLEPFRVRKCRRGNPSLSHSHPSWEPRILRGQKLITHHSQSWAFHSPCRFCSSCTSSQIVSLFWIITKFRIAGRRTRIHPPVSD